MLNLAAFDTFLRTLESYPQQPPNTLIMSVPMYNKIKKMFKYRAMMIAVFGTVDPPLAKRRKVRYSDGRMV